jgi:hypothetical protein
VTPLVSLYQLQCSIVPLQCNPMYLGLKFNLEFKSFLCRLLNQVIITTCKGTSKMFMQVSQYKFTLWKMMSRKNFSEFTRFSPKV